MVLNCSQKVNKFWRPNTHCDYSQQHHIIYFKVATRLGLKCPHYEIEMTIKWHDGGDGRCYSGHHIAIYKHIESTHCVSQTYTMLYTHCIHFFKKMCDFFMVERQSCLQGNYIKFLGSWSQEEQLVTPTYTVYKTIIWNIEEMECKVSHGRGWDVGPA